MAFTFDATPKATTANSYVSVAVADDYFEGRQNSGAWAGLASLTKQRLLVSACNRLEAELYLGEKTTQGQRLKWPRVDVLDDAGYLYDADTVPRYVQEAQMELAWAMQQGGTTDFFADTGLEGFTDIDLGPLSISRNLNTVAGQLPASVARLIASFRMGARLVRG